MLKRAAYKNPRLVQGIGLLALIAGSLLNLFWKAAPGPVADWADAGKGLLYGISIALLLGSIAWRRKRD